MSMFEVILTISAGITAVAAAIVVMRKFYLWWLPCSASISYKLVLDVSGPDKISVKITNKSTSSIYVKSCDIRSTYPVRSLLWLHIKRPFLSPSLYPNLWYNGAVYNFVKGDPVKIEPGQLVPLKIEIYEHPLNSIYGPMLLARVALTTGQVVRSKRIRSPQVWRMIGKRGR